MPITFEALPETEQPEILNAGLGALRFTGFGSSLSFADGAMGHGFLEFVQIPQSLVEAPSEILLGIGSGELEISGYGFAPRVNLAASGEGYMAFEGYGYEAPDIGRGVLRFVGSGVSLRDGDVIPTPGGSDEWAVFYQDIAFNDGVRDLAYILARSALKMRGQNKTRSTLRAKFKSNLALDDQFALVYKLLLQDSIEFGDGLTLNYVAIARMHDRLLVEGVVNTSAEAYALITSAIAFGAALDATELLPFADALSLSEMANAYATAAAKLVDLILFDDALVGTATFMAFMSDSLAMSGSITTMAEAFARMHDTLGFTLHFTLEDGHYSAWTMNTDSRASTRYDNYPFNSYMVVGGKHYGVSDVGVHRLEGDDDDGTDIKAHIRLGMNALGNRMKKHVPSVYLGYSANGDMFIKAIVSDSTAGAREAHVYRLYGDGAASQREARAKFGRGLEAVYWDFQIENVDGADFDLDVIEFVPLAVNRRLRGNAGGKR